MKRVCADSGHTIWYLISISSVTMEKRLVVIRSKIHNNLWLMTSLITYARALERCISQNYIIYSMSFPSIYFSHSNCSAHLISWLLSRRMQSSLVINMPLVCAPKDFLFQDELLLHVEDKLAWPFGTLWWTFKAINTLPARKLAT